MGRTAKYTPEQFVDAALDLVAESGPTAVTMTAVAGKLNAPIGSVYHRFASRDLLLAGLWLRTVRTFQEGFVDTLRKHGGIEAALYTPRWVRKYPKEARLLLLYRREELVSGPWPKEIQESVLRLAGELDAAIARYSQELFGAVTDSALLRTRFALIDVPYAAVRRCLVAREPLPEGVDELVAESCTVILGRLS